MQRILVVLSIPVAWSCNQNNLSGSNSEMVLAQSISNSDFQQREKKEPCAYAPGKVWLGGIPAN
jgi:hypothetical protein